MAPTRQQQGIRAIFVDAMGQLEKAASVKDPHPGDAEGWGYAAGMWPGAPCDQLPPDCPVIPLGVDEGTYFFMDSLQQLNRIHRSDMNKKTLQDLFGKRPHYMEHHWPRRSTKAKDFELKGLHVDDVSKCLIKACQDVGIFNQNDKVRGRGMWKTGTGQLVWHAGEALYQVRGKRLVMASPSQIEGSVYPGRPRVMAPWQEPVGTNESPAQELLATLATWSWERPWLDPILVIGWIGCAFLGAALPWRPTLFVTGDKGVGKSTLQFVVKGMLGDALHKTANTTAAGIYQRVGRDSLPVAVDELEAGNDNRRSLPVIELARLTASGDQMFRGGADHTGVSFQLQNAFFFSAINPPPMEPADKSRMAILNLARLDQSRAAKPVMIDGDSASRMILRQIMDAWPTFDATLSSWQTSLREAGFDQRAQSTYGTLLAVAAMLLGDEAMEAAGLPITESRRLGELLADATASERAEQGENWRQCLEYVLGSVIDAYKSGEKPTVGGAIELWEKGAHTLEIARSQVSLVGLGLIERGDRRFLAVPNGTGQALNRLFAGTKWAGGVWGSALRQAPPDVVIRDLGNGQNVKINRVNHRCVLVDLAAYDKAQ